MEPFNLRFLSFLFISASTFLLHLSFLRLCLPPFRPIWKGSYIEEIRKAKFFFNKQTTTPIEWDKSNLDKNLVLSWWTADPTEHNLFFSETWLASVTTGGQSKGKNSIQNALHGFPKRHQLLPRSCLLKPSQKRLPRSSKESDFTHWEEKHIVVNALKFVSDGRYPTVFLKEYRNSHHHKSKKGQKHFSCLWKTALITHYILRQHVFVQSPQEPSSLAVLEPLVCNFPPTPAPAFPSPWTFMALEFMVDSSFTSILEKCHAIFLTSRVSNDIPIITWICVFLSTMPCFCGSPQVVCLYLQKFNYGGLEWTSLCVSHWGVTQLLENVGSGFCQGHKVFSHAFFNYLGTILSFLPGLQWWGYGCRLSCGPPRFLRLFIFLSVYFLSDASSGWTLLLCPQIYWFCLCHLHSMMQPIQSIFSFSYFLSQFYNFHFVLFYNFCFFAEIFYFFMYVKRTHNGNWSIFKMAASKSLSDVSGLL